MNIVVENINHVDLEIHPKDNMYKDNMNHYLSVGISALKITDKIIDEFSLTPKSILDYACGFGRVTRHFVKRFSDCKIIACEIMPDAISFLKQRFGVEGIVLNKDFDLVKLDVNVDLIWVGSLLTHLSEIDGRKLLNLLQDSLNPNGVLICSFHGDHVIKRFENCTHKYGLDTDDQMSKKLADDCNMTGYSYMGYPNMLGYGISLSKINWFHENIDKDNFKIIKHYTKEWDNHHDVVVLQRNK